MEEAIATIQGNIFGFLTVMVLIAAFSFLFVNSILRKIGVDGETSYLVSQITFVVTITIYFLTR